MADSDSPLSSPPSTDDEALQLKMSKPTGLDRYFKPTTKKEDTPSPPRRAPSPPHEYTLADNDTIAFLVMFRSRFSDAFPKSLPHYGPQDIESGVSGDLPDEQVERYLCALLGLVMNRKKDVERGHYGRALEDAISTHQNQWPAAWNGTNPLRGDKSFNNMSAEGRLTLLKTLVLWSLNSSEIVQALIKESYKQTRRDDDKNQPRSVQPWFSDSYRRRYWLVEGQDDSFFRIFRENDGKTTKSNAWFSVAGSIEDVNALADKFTEEGTSNAKVNAEKLRGAIPRFEAGEEKRRRKEYRLARKAAFVRPEPGYSIYEGRTRGKRMRYTYSDGEEDSDTGRSTRRSTRNPTPLDNGPTVTSSGRQVKPRMGGAYGEALSTDQRREHELGEDGIEDSDDMPTTAPIGRGARRPSARSHEVYREDAIGSDEESDEEAQDSGKDWSGNEDEPDASESEADFADDDEISGDEIDDDEPQDDRSLVVKLSYRKPKPSAAGPELRKNGLPVLLPKAHAKPIAPERQNRQYDEDAIEVAAVPTSDTTAASRGERTHVDGISQGRTLQPMVNGYGGHEGVLKAAHVPHPLSQKPMHAMDVS